MDRQTFADRQAAMTSNWYEEVKRREGDVAAYIARRHSAYLDRWKEAGRFIPDGSAVLDLGGGNLFPDLFSYLRSKQIDYHYRDVDPAAVNATRELGRDYGYSGERFQLGFNDELDIADQGTDNIFSSHCIEHSIDLQRTFAELNRVLRPGGNLLMAVPLGWERNPEHPYFFDVALWIALVEDAGFEVRVTQIGKEYPESGHDLFIAARKSSAPAAQSRIDPADYRKESYRFHPFNGAGLRLRGDARAAQGLEALHLRGADWQVTFRLPPGTSEACPILLHHPWSGQVSVTTGSSQVSEDLYSSFTYVQPVRHKVSPRATSVELRPCGRHPASRGTEAVLFGFLLR